jgi:thioredoxin-like negative regulator of GroEL
VESVKDANTLTLTKEVSQSTKPTIVYFWHDQCPWRLKLNLLFNEIVEEYKNRIGFVKINILEDPNNRQGTDNYGVISTPTLLFLCRRKPVGQVVGLMSKEDLERGLDDILGRYQQCFSQSTELKPAYIV